VTVLHVLIPLLGVAFTAFHAAFARWLLNGIPFAPKRAPASYETPNVTVLVAARDEAGNLPSLIPALLAQSYPVDRTQIVLVDDRSSDATSELARELGQGRVEVIRVDELPSGMGPKKHALLRGLGVARGEIVVQLDADNVPDPDWLSCMIQRFQPHTAPGSPNGSTGSGRWRPWGGRRSRRRRSEPANRSPPTAGTSPTGARRSTTWVGSFATRTWCRATTIS